MTELHNDVYYARLAQKYRNENDTENYLLYIAKAIELNPSEIDYYDERGALYFQYERFEEAIEDFSAIIKIDPYNKDALRRRNALYIIIQDYEKAIIDLTHLLEAVKDSPGPDDDTEAEMLYEKAFCYAYLNDYQKAIENYNYAIAKEPNPNWIYFRSLIYIKLGQKDDAIKDLSLFLELEKNNNFFINEAKRLLDECKQ